MYSGSVSGYPIYNPEGTSLTSTATASCVSSLSSYINPLKQDGESLVRRVTAPPPLNENADIETIKQYLSEWVAQDLSDVKRIDVKYHILRFLDSNWIPLMKLDGSMPDIFNLAVFKSLKDLTCKIDSATSLPSTFVNLTSLNSLTMEGSFEYLPCEVFELSLLKKLKVNSSKLSLIQPEISKLKSLESFEIFGDGICPLQTLPLELYQCASLRSLTIYNTSMKSLLPGISELRLLETLRMSCHSTFVIPSEVAKLTSLTTLKLTGYCTDLPDEVWDMPLTCEIEVRGRNVRKDVEDRLNERKIKRDEEYAKSSSESIKRELLNEIEMARIEKEQSLQIQEKENAEFEKLVANYLSTFSHSIRRINSLSNLDEINETKEEACKARSGHLWNCVDRKPFKFGGYIYLFEGKDEYNNLTPHPDLAKRTKNVEEKTTELIPAIEIMASAAIAVLNYERGIELQAEAKIKDAYQDMIDRNNEVTYPLLEDTIRQGLLSYQERRIRASSMQESRDIRELKFLGYKASEENGKVLMELPDKEALMGGWQALRTIYPERNLPLLDIASGKEIADDLSYAEAYFNYNVLLSTGIEFCHDHHSHVMAQMKHMLRGSGTYQPEKARLNRLIFSVYRTIHIAKQVELEESKQRWDLLRLIPGMLTDSMFSYPPRLVETIDEDFIETSIASFGTTARNGQSYFQRRFPNLTSQELKRVWDEAKQAEKAYDAKRELASQEAASLTT